MSYFPYSWKIILLSPSELAERLFHSFKSPYSLLGHQNAADCPIALSAISGGFSSTPAAAYPPSEPPAIVRASAVSGHVLFRSFATEAAHGRMQSCKAVARTSSSPRKSGLC